jgi:hypothetical protein
VQSPWLVVVAVVVGLFVLGWLLRTLRCLVRAIILLAVLAVVAFVLYNLGVLPALR